MEQAAKTQEDCYRQRIEERDRLVLKLIRRRYRARFAECEEDVRRAQRLRYQAFYQNRNAMSECDGIDKDKFDESCLHVLIEDVRSDDLVACFRLMQLKDGSDISSTYSAQYYGLSNLKSFDRPMSEMGRFCIKPGVRDPNIIRLAWKMIANYVDDTGVEMLFGCSSFEGIDAGEHMEAFALLREHYIAPKRWLPKVKAPRVFRFGSLSLGKRTNLKLAMRKMPPLLKSYLLLGGWVSDHAVVDRDLSTLHVFTGLEIRAVPLARANLIRGVELS